MPKFTPAVSELAPHEKYYLMLGRFIQRFSSIEAAMQKLLSHYTDVSPTVARSIFSGVRMDQASSFIRRIHKARSIEMHPILGGALDQIGVINTARNYIIHYGAEFDAGEPLYVSNQRVVNRPEETQRFPISISILDALTADIAHIQLRFGLIRNQSEMKPARFQKTAQNFLKRAWRYKHAPQIGIHP